MVNVYWKIVRSITGFVLRCSIWILVLFLLFVAYHMLLPRLSEWFRDQKENIAVKQLLKERLEGIEEELSAAIANRENVKTRFVDLERALEEEKQRNQIRINNKRHEIDYLQSQRWSIRLYWINPVAWKHERKIGWAVAELKQLQALDFILPTGVSIWQMETQLSEAKSLLERMTLHVASIEHQQREATEQHDEQTKKSQNVESFQRCLQSFTRWLIPLVLVFTATPLLWALLMYYVIAPLVACTPRVRFPHANRQSIIWSEATRVAKIRLQPGDTLVCRSDWLTQHDGSSKQTKVFWSFSHWAVSVAAQLFLCTYVSNQSGHAKQLVLNSRDANVLITQIHLQEESGLILQPRCIVAIRGKVTVRSHWKLWSPQAWLTGKLRFLIFSGVGTIYIEGYGGNEIIQIENRTQHLERQFTLGFESQITYAVKRTETFWPYYRGKSSLFEDSFSGKGTIVRATSTISSTGTPPERGLAFVCSLLGKLVGL